MWLSFWKPKDRLSLDELRFLIDQLTKVHIVNEDFVVEALRSIAQLITYGDQHDTAYFEAISGKLNKDTMSLLVKTQNDEVVSFPLYLEAIQFASHEESMIRTAVRALTLNVYHVGDNAVNRFLSRAPHSDYFGNLVNIFREQCINLNEVVSNASKNLGVQSTSFILSVVDEIEDSLYYFNDIVSAGIPDVGRFIMDNILTLLIFPLLLPSMRIGAVSEPRLGAVTSVNLLCCILRIVKIKDLANTLAAALLCRTETFIKTFEAISNGNVIGHDSKNAGIQSSEESHRCSESDAGSLETIAMIPSFSNYRSPNGIMTQNYGDIHLTPRDALLSLVNCGNDVQVSGSLNVLATLLQTKDLDESMMDAIGLLPQRKQHTKFLEAMVGEDSGVEQNVSSQSTEVQGGIGGELDIYLQRLKVYYGVPCANTDIGVSPRVHRLQVIDALDSFLNCSERIIKEARGTWADQLAETIHGEWQKCKRVIEAPSPRKDPKCLLLPPNKSTSEEAEHRSSESSFAAGKRMHETVKVFVLLHHLRSFSLGRVVPDQPPLLPTVDIPEKTRAENAGIELKTNTEINLVPCRIATRRGKEHHLHFLPLCIGSSGWLVLAEKLTMKPRFGLIREAAPLAGCNPKIDERLPMWLHLRIRPSPFPFSEKNLNDSVKPKILLDGRWTLAFRDKETCKHALDMTLQQVELQCDVVEKSLRPLLKFDLTSDNSSLRQVDNDSS